MTEPLNGFTGFAKRNEGARRSSVGVTGNRYAPAWAAGGKQDGPATRDATHGAEPDAAGARAQSAADAAAAEQAQPAMRAAAADAVSSVNLRPVAGAKPQDGVSASDLRGAYVQVDTGAIVHNVQTVRRLLRPGTHVMAVVNADAFGHGLVEVAQAALGAGADHLGVATVDEGVRLRAARVFAPILVLSQPPVEAIPVLLGQNLMPSVCTPDFAMQYGEAADANGTGAPYHLALNTGMNRMGLQAEDAADFMHSIGFHRALELKGVFTHFATAEQADLSGMRQQFHRFIEAVTAMHDAGYDTGIVHCASTAAAVRFPESRLHMVRLGRGLYGMHPCTETRSLPLRCAMEVRARISDLRWPQMSEGVSYGLNFRTAGSSIICTLPIGYADGVPEVLSGRFDVLYNGLRCRQVGAVCMDQCMFEVEMRSSTDRARVNPRIGDEVTVVGRQGDLIVALSDLAKQAGMSQTALACAFGSRLPRVFTK